MTLQTDPTLRLLEDLVSIDSVNPSLVPGARGEEEIARRIADETIQQIRDRIDTLTKRELEVMKLVVEARLTKQIADAIEEKLRGAKARPGHVEGRRRAEWTPSRTLPVDDSGWTAL